MATITQQVSPHHPQDDLSSHKPWTQPWWEPRLVAVTAMAIVGGFIAGQMGAPQGLVLFLHIVSYLAGGWFGAKTALESLLERRIDVDLLMILAALGAATIGQWSEGAILLFLFSLSNVLQDYAIGRSRKAIQSLLKLYPELATVHRDGKRLLVKTNDIRLDDIVLIEPGERIPVDGVVLAGRSAVDESPITGESMPVDKEVGSLVFAGTLNKHGALDIRPTKLATDTMLARIIQLVEEAQSAKAPTERFLDTFEQVYALFIIITTVLLIIVPPSLGLADFQSNFYRAMVLMTVASPCALVISVPAAFISAIASAARLGVLFKGGAYLEALAGVRAVAFDKTGTLTSGQPRLTDCIPTAGLTESALLQYAADIESRSEHPLAKAIVAAAVERGIAPQPVDDFMAIAGRGVHARQGERHLRAGSLSYLVELCPIPDDLRSRADALEAQGKTVVGVLFMEDGEWYWGGLLAIADQLRPEAPAVVAQLQANGIAVAMLTGDNPRVAQTIAQQANIRHVYAGLLPSDKVAVLKALQERFGPIAMVGDGVNDAPALAHADIGIAMGAAGTDVALETADVVLMGDKLPLIVAALALSRKARRVVWQNIAFSLMVIALLVLGAFFIALPLPLGVLGHEGSTVIVVLNGLFSLLILPEISRRRAARATSRVS